MKKYFWIAALIAALAFVMAGCNVGVVGEGGGGGEEGGETIIIDLPLEFTAIKSDGPSETQKGWCTNGTDDVVTTLKIADLKAAKYLVLELDKKPTGGMQFIWQGDGNSWGWDQQDILSGDGSPDASKGAKFRGESRAADNSVLEIELSKAMKNYNSLKASTQAKFFIAYYSPDIAGLGITKAYLEIIKGGAPPPPATVTSVAVTPATATIEQGTARQYTAAVEGENNPKNTVRWTISGQTKPGTTLSASGRLTVAADEPVGTEITVTATSTVDKTKSGYVVVTVVEPEVVASGIFRLDDPDSDWWHVNGTDNKVTSLDIETLIDAKYLVLKVESKADNNGFGGLQFAAQTDADNYDWHAENVAGGWNQPSSGDGQWDINYSEVDVFYIVIDLTQVAFWNDFIDCIEEEDTDKAKFGFSTFPTQITLDRAYLVSKTKPLTKPATAFDITCGWAAKTVSELD